MYEEYIFIMLLATVTGALLFVFVTIFEITIIPLPNNPTEVKRTFTTSCTEYFNSTIVCNEYKSRGLLDFYPDKMEIFRK